MGGEWVDSIAEKKRRNQKLTRRELGIWDAWNSFKDTVSNAVGNAVDNAKKGALDLAKDSAQHLGEWVDSIAEKKRRNQKLTPRELGIWDAWNSFKDTVSNAVGNAVDNAKNQALDFAKDSAESVGEWVDSLAEKKRRNQKLTRRELGI